MSQLSPSTRPSFGPSNRQLSRGLSRSFSRSLSRTSSYRESVRESIRVNREEKKRRKRWGLIPDWPRERWIFAMAGCTSASAVLAIRLYLDLEPTAYLIHSIIVFFDMILIHLFTNCRWLSISGELVTYLAVLAFTLTNETVYELAETTMIAILCSFHLILSRSKALDQRDVLEEDMMEMKRRGTVLLRNIQLVQGELMNQVEKEDSEPLPVVKEEETGSTDDEHDEESVESFGDLEVAAGDAEEEAKAKQQLEQELKNVCRRRTKNDKSVVKRVKGWMNQTPEQMTERLEYVGEKFFEHFLDGSAGVMYTSFLGLIIDEILKYGSDKGY